VPGLRFQTGLDVASGPQPRYGNAASPTSVQEAAFGTANSPDSPMMGLHPANPGALAFWIGVAGTVFLVVLYRSLPG
jgi:hypothetical protein